MKKSLNIFSIKKRKATTPEQWKEKAIKGAERAIKDHGRVLTRLAEYDRSHER